MSQRGFMAMGLRLLGIYAFIVGASSLQYMGYVISSLSRETDFKLVILLILLAPFIVGLVLLIKADRLAAWLGYGTEPMGLATKTNLGGREIQGIGFSLVGALVLIRVVGNLAGSLSSILMVFLPPSGLAGDWGRLVTHSLLGSLALVLQIGLGLGLFFGARRLADWWHDRYAPPEEIAEDA